jgi:signal transduction histidine kinase
VLTLGTAFAGLGYVTLVVSVSKVVDSRTGAYWLSLIATALVAVAFQPLRRTVVAVASRMAFGSRAQPYEALAAFSRQLSVTPSAPTLLATVADAAGRAVSAHGATASLDASDLPRASVFWGSDGAHTVHEHRVLVEEGGVTLGSIEVSIPHGRPFRPSDVRLLRAIADQAGVAFHNLAMQAQLDAHVLSLDRSTEELADSRARIVEADDAARRSLAAGLSGEVLPRLRAVSESLNRPGSSGNWSPQRLDDMVTGVNAALESLRELTQGVFPTQLVRSGLEPALRSYLRRHDHGTQLEVSPDARGQRFAARVEGAVYFAATRAAGTGLGPGSVTLGVDEDGVCCTVTGADPSPRDLEGIRDRVQAVGGSLRSSSGTLELRIPLTSSLAATTSGFVGGSPRG